MRRCWFSFETTEPGSSFFSCYFSVYFIWLFVFCFFFLFFFFCVCTCVLSEDKNTAGDEQHANLYPKTIAKEPPVIWRIRLKKMNTLISTPKPRPKSLLLPEKYSWRRWQHANLYSKTKARESPAIRKIQMKKMSNTLISTPKPGQKSLLLPEKYRWRRWATC